MRKSAAKYLRRFALIAPESTKSRFNKKHKFRNSEGKVVTHNQVIDPASVSRRGIKRLWNSTPRPERFKVMKDIKSKLGIK